MRGPEIGTNFRIKLQKKKFVRSNTLAQMHNLRNISFTETVITSATEEKKVPVFQNWYFVDDNMLFYDY